MRDITHKAIQCFLTNKPFKCNNTKVEIKDKVVHLILYNSIIAYRSCITREIAITNCNYFTNTTKERLNGIPGVEIKTKKGTWFLNGRPWNGEFININYNKYNNE